MMTYAPVWTVEHDAFLRACLLAGMTTGKAAIALNKKFRTSYTRNACIGRATRHKMPRGDAKAPNPTPAIAPTPQPKVKRRRRRIVVVALAPKPQPAPAPRARPMKPALFWIEELRCAEVDPLNIDLLDLQHNQCRWPSGDGRDEPYKFCGHPIVWDSYCGPHKALSIGGGTPSERQTHRVSRKVA